MTMTVKSDQSPLIICDGVLTTAQEMSAIALPPPDVYLHSNGITILCPNASVGDTGVINGVNYTKRDRPALDALIDSHDTVNIEKSCISGITDLSLAFHHNLAIVMVQWRYSTWDTSHGYRGVCLKGHCFQPRH